MLVRLGRGRLDAQDLVGDGHLSASLGLALEGVTFWTISADITTSYGAISPMVLSFANSPFNAVLASASITAPPAASACATG